ncbi:MAG: hypothetical protein HN404_13820 [Gemmatimonadetes bacterium]|nr:hypothetical protein [Gemmatimonadota bacterium]
MALFRPRFRLVVPLSIEDLSQRLQAAVEAPSAPAAGKVLRDFAVLRVLPGAQHFWSPELTLQLHPAEEGGTLIRGLFGPRAAVWTGFACFHIFGIFISLMALLFGLSQWSLGMEPFGLWLLPIPLILTISAFVTALVGQRLGEDQMRELRLFLDETVGS